MSLSNSVLLKQKSKQNKLFFQTLVNESNQGICTADLQGNFIFVNHCFCQMTEYSETELLTMKVFDVTEPEYKQSVFEKTLLTKSHLVSQLPLQRKDQTTFIAEVISQNIKIDNILEQIDLTHVARLPVRNFSSGMTKRLMIGRLMLYQPKILILDEPYTGLDQHSFHWFQDYLQKFHQQGGTVLMVTHQLELGLELATRVLVLHQQGIQHDISATGLSVDQCSAWLEE